MKNKNTSQIQTYEKLQGLGPASDSSYKCYNTTQPARGSERGKSIWIARFDLYSKIWFPLSTTAVGCAYFSFTSCFCCCVHDGWARACAGPANRHSETCSFASPYFAFIFDRMKTLAFSPPVPNRPPPSSSPNPASAPPHHIPPLLLVQSPPRPLLLP
jgi:hypothetical protein